MWRRNAKDVADAVSRLVLQVDAKLVALTGDVRAVQLLQAVLPKEVSALVQVLDGSRSVDGSAGVNFQQLNARPGRSLGPRHHGPAREAG